MAKEYKKPGVYIVEQAAFPGSIVTVPTAVPAFIGYTEKATYNGKDFTHVPTRISSLGEYQLYFGEGPKTLFDFEPADDFNKAYSLTTGPRYLLFQCIKMFFANGGTDCYIVSIGDYASGFKLQDFDHETTENGVANRCGLQALLNEAEPTIVVIPEAVCLSEADCHSLQQSILKHCGEATRSRFAILDVFDGFKKRTHDDADVIDRFRRGIGMNYLQWGAAYYPWLHTTITSAGEVDFTNLTLDAKDKLMSALMAEVDRAGMKADQAESIRSVIKLAKGYHPNNPTGTESTQHQILLLISPLYKSVMASLLEQINLLPPSAAMAGIYSMVDNNSGVFQSPANVSVGSVVGPAANLTNDEQEDLNLPLDGKAVNAIRTFPGKGVLVWGARTLDGNSQDWRYINVRRTVIFLEQSIKKTAMVYVLDPNIAATWAHVKDLLTIFLTRFWSEGGLVGGTPNDAFSVNIGLGTTMTSTDILDGYMRITVKVAITHPNEFLLLNFEQQMQQP